MIEGHYYPIQLITSIPTMTYTGYRIKHTDFSPEDVPVGASSVMSKVKKALRLIKSRILMNFGKDRKT